MLTLHATMPALSPAALRRLYASHSLLVAVLGGVAAWLFGPGVPAACVFTGVLLAAQLTAEVALRRRARRRAPLFIPRRDWRAAWWRASDARSDLIHALAFGFGLTQVTQGRPAWALDPLGWAVFAFTAGVMLLATLAERKSWTAGA